MLSGIDTTPRGFCRPPTAYQGTSVPQWLLKQSSMPDVQDPKANQLPAVPIVGREGIVGIAIFMGGETTPSRAIVQSAGHAYRLSARVLKDEFSRGPCSTCCFRYAQALITQMAQTAVCNRHHRSTSNCVGGSC